MVWKARSDHGKKDGTPAPKGQGRKPHPSTVLAREAIATFVDGNSSRIQQWLDEVYEAEGAKAALQCFESLIEYHVPKLSRVEHKGEVATELKITWDDA